MESTCANCKAEIDALKAKCHACGIELIVEPSEVARAKSLRRPSLGALFFTQGFALGSRLYGWFLLSLIPIVGFVALAALVVFGRRWSWKRGGWTDWKEFESRMRLLDALAAVWIIGLLIGWWALRKNG
ncbi:hypothetical protein EBS80_03465 [bacterium]|nr:hypothetical protein [bacterium]